MKISELFKDSPGKTVHLSGNEAFARGIFEAGVSFSANYPGTPLSEVGDYLNYLSCNSPNFTFDYSVNEKVALESCIGVSWAGLRSVVMFKHLGMNVAADPLHSFPYSGVIGGMLIINGGDPGILSSTNAQDNRLYSLHTKIPILEPATVQECKDYIKLGLELSEKYEIPIIINTTARLCHGQGLVKLGEIQQLLGNGSFKKDPDRFINTRGQALSNQKKYFDIINILEKDEKIHEKFNFIKKLKIQSKNEYAINEHVGIITSGDVIEACYKLRINPPILKLGVIFPINKQEILQFVKTNHLKTLLIIEELEPFLESSIHGIMYPIQDSSQSVQIHGKDFLPNIGELSSELIMDLFSRHFMITNHQILDEINQKEEILKEILPSLPLREPSFCPGCQYRPVFYALKKVTQRIEKEKEVRYLFSGDIGCYTLSEAYPYQLIDWVVCMGAGIGIANGMVHAVDSHKQKLIAYVGDSTLFHSGLQPLLNAIKNDVDLTVIIFYNYWTAMTGHQLHIATPTDLIPHSRQFSKTDVKGINIQSFLKALGIDNLVITGAYNIEKLERIFADALLKKGLKVILIDEECALEKKRRLKEIDSSERDEFKSSYSILDTCVKCNECIEYLGCPAINVGDQPSEKDEETTSSSKGSTLEYYIDQSKCIPEVCPGICKAVCKNNAIKKILYKTKGQIKDN